MHAVGSHVPLGDELGKNLAEAFGQVSGTQLVPDACI